MKILLASSEVHPFSKTGGLADMVGALGKALARKGHQVGLITPLYAGIRERYPQLKPTSLPLDFPLGVRRFRGEVWSLNTIPGLTIYFVDQPDFFQRASLYQKDGMDYPDNAERFMFFSKAVAHLAFHLPWKPEVLHVHDWQASLATLFVHHQKRIPAWRNGPGTCLTVHNLAYQGQFPSAQYQLTNLPWEYFIPSGVEFYGGMNCLKAGISYADIITTVSPRYAREITTEEFGCGLDGLLRQRPERLLGILNGVDYSEWNTYENPYIHQAYAIDTLHLKARNKASLQQELGLPERVEIPLFANIGRMVEQKGVDILYGALEEMLHADIQVVILGSGASRFQRAFQDLGRRFANRAAVRIGFDEGLSHRIEAASDFFLMPSRFEPCGLNQMYSLRYGAVPIVRAVGGLDDTVLDFKEQPEAATGIKFYDYSSSAVTKAMRKAIAIYNNPTLLHWFRRNGMECDFSWDRTAGEYVEVYAQIKNAN